MWLRKFRFKDKGAGRLGDGPQSGKLENEFGVGVSSGSEILRREAKATWRQEHWWRGVQGVRSQSGGRVIYVYITTTKNDD